MVSLVGGFKYQFSDKFDFLFLTPTCHLSFSGTDHGHAVSATAAGLVLRD